LHNLTNVGLDGIHSAFLKEIDFRWNEKIQDQGILTIVSNNLNLRSIHLVNCHSLAEKLVSFFFYYIFNHKLVILVFFY
jgi:hypothetical protein